MIRKSGNRFSEKIMRKQKPLAGVTALYRTIFPQMTNCLPEEEGAQLRFDFEAELARLKAA